MFKLIAVVLVILVAAVLLYAATRPGDFRVERSLKIDAPAEKIFPHIDDLHAWSAWSPYEKMDPLMKRTFSGAPSGIGAIYQWNGNQKVGEGRMQIVDAHDPSSVVFQLDFIRPFEGHNVATFTLQPAGDSTTVTWAMAGPAPYLSRLTGVFLDMDHLIGRDFETGLANLKTVSEAGA